MMNGISEFIQSYENDGVPLYIAFAVAAIYVNNIPFSSLRDRGFQYHIIQSEQNGILRVMHSNHRYDFDLDTGDLLGFLH